MLPAGQLDKVKAGDKVTVEFEIAEVSPTYFLTTTGSRIYIKDVGYALSPKFLTHTPKPVDITVGMKFPNDLGVKDYWTVVAIHNDYAWASNETKKDYGFIMSFENVYRRLNSI